MISHNKTNSCRQNSTINNRPLQQIYKTIYRSPLYENHCTRIRQPLEKYKTTNMIYGSFYYNNWAFVQKNRWANCINNNKQRRMVSNGKHTCFQLINDRCCSIDCICCQK